nr:putative ribonuclease H-like domain-containing protein [Tanacetum cinerariifolium]
APRAWYETLANYLLENGFQRGKIDQTLLIKKQKGDILLVQVYVDDIIFGSTNKDLCKGFEKLMKEKFQMSSMGELTLFLDGKSASTPIDTKKPLVKDPNGEDVDVHTYRSIIGSLMYLTSSRLDIVFAVCACAHFQVKPKASHLHAVKRIFRYLKGKPHLGLWYPKDSPFNLVAYSNSDYAGASLDRKSTTEGCQFLGCRLISWQYKKQTVVATSSTKAEYVAAASYCAQVLWIQKQLLDYGELLRMGYEKPSTKLTFYKAFFSAQWKFLIHTILQCISAKRTSWNEFSSSMASAIICLSTGRKLNFSKYIFDNLVRNVDSSSKCYMYPQFLQLMIRAQVGDLSSHTTKYSSPTLTQKVFANMRMAGKGFSRVETPLFKGMLVPQQAAADVDDVVADDDAADDVPATDTEPTPPLTTPPPPPQELPSISQVVPTPLPSPLAQPSSPPQQQQPLQPTIISMDLLNNLLESCTALTRRVKNLEQDKIAQALEIIQLKKWVRKLEKKRKLRGDIIANIDADEDATLKDVAAVAKEIEVEKTAEIEKDADVQGRPEESQAQIYKIDLEHADKVLSMQDDFEEPTELQEVIEVVTTTKLMTEVVTAATTTITAAAPITAAPSAARRRKGVVIRDPEETAAPSVIIHTEPKSKDKGKGIMVQKPKPLKKQAQIEHEEEESRALKRQRKNLEEKAAKKQKLDEEVEELKKHLQIVPNDDDDVYTEATPLALKVLFVDYEIYSENNKPFYKIIRANRSYQLFMSFLSLLRNFDGEDLEMLWKIVQERFASSKPKNFFDDFLLTILTYMFTKPDVEAQVWKNQRSVHGLENLKAGDC